MSATASTASGAIPPHFNFARKNGIVNVVIPGVFAVLYLPLLCWHFYLFKNNRTYVYASVTLFCFTRLPSFIIRALLASDKDASAELLRLVIADQVIFGIGFFGLLYSAYILVLDREALIGHAPHPKHISWKFRRNRALFRALLLVAIILNIVVAAMTTATRSPTTDHKLLAMKQTSTGIFFALAVLEAALLLRLVWYTIKDKLNGVSYEHITTPQFGSRYTMPLLIIVSIFVLLRQTFVMATVNNSVTQNKEHFWYPFVTIPELMAALIYGVPGLVPLNAHKVGDKHHQDDPESQHTDPQASQLSVASRETQASERAVPGVILISEKRKSVRWDSRSEVNTVHVVGFPPEDMPGMSTREDLHDVVDMHVVLPASRDVVVSDIVVREEAFQ